MAKKLKRNPSPPLPAPTGSVPCYPGRKRHRWGGRTECCFCGATRKYVVPVLHPLTSDCPLCECKNSVWRGFCAHCQKETPNDKLRHGGEKE